MICLLWIADVCVHVCAHVCVYMWCMITCVWRRTQPYTYADAKRGFQYLPPSLSIILLFFLRLILSLDPRLTFQFVWLTSQLLRSVCLHISALVFQVQPCPAWDPPAFPSTGVPGTAMFHFYMGAEGLNSVISDFTQLYCPLSSLLEPTIEFCRPSSFPLLYRYRNFPKVSQLMVKLGLLFPIATFVLSVSICILKHKLPELCLLKNL